MSSNQGGQIELPKYKCHKEVWALKISKVEPYPKMASESYGGATLSFEDERYAPIFAEYDYVNKHNPQVGGYYVVYEDGYTSFSPAEAFENGYTKIE